MGLRQASHNIAVTAIVPDTVFAVKFLEFGVTPFVPEGVELFSGGFTPGACSDTDIDLPNGPFTLVWDQTTLNVTGTLAERTATAYVSVTTYLRPSTAGELSYIDLSPFTFTGNALAHITVSAIDGSGNVVAIASIDGELAIFSPSAVTEVAGFRIVLDDDIDTDFSWADGSFIQIFGGPGGPESSGSVTTAVLTPGNRYMIKQTTGIYGWKESASSGQRNDTKWDVLGGTSWSGHIGSDGSVFHTVMPTGFSHVVQGGGAYHKMYFIAQATTVRGSVYSTTYADNVNVNGGMVAEINNATTTGNRQVTLDNTGLNNVCITESDEDILFDDASATLSDDGGGILHETPG